MYATFEPETSESQSDCSLVSTKSLSEILSSYG